MTTKKRNIRRPQQFEESKVEGYFMISRRDALLAISNRLTGSQLRLWIYLMAIDSFADYTAGGEIKYHDLPPLADIAVAIGGSLDRVEKDLRNLRKLGLYDYRTVTVQGHNLTAAKAKVEAERLSKTKSQSRSKSSQGKGSAYLDPNGDYLDPNGDYLDPNGDYLDPNGDYLDPDQSLKSAPGNASSTPQTIQTYSDFINTLSDSEREIFEKFVREEWKRLKGEDVINMERFLAKEEDFKSWHQSFLNSPAGKEAKKKAIALYDRTQHSDWEDWLAMMRQGVPRFVALGTCFDNKTRRAIADWALERNLVWGTES